MNNPNNYDNNKINLNNSCNELTNTNKWNAKKIYKTSKDTFGKEKLNGCDNKLGLPSLSDHENEELIKENKELKKELNTVKEKYKKLTATLERQQKEKTSRDDVYGNQKCGPKYQPMTLMIYNRLISDRRTTEFYRYNHIRLRVAFCILFITGINLSHLLTLKVYQLQTLLENHWISINNFEQDNSNSKASLSEEGKKVIQARQQDFKIILSGKTPNSYVFTSEFRPNRMLRRETMSRDINKRIKSVSSQLPHKISITTHSFRVGDITQLWEDSRDIELVRQSIYLQRFDTTSTYVS